LAAAILGAQLRGEDDFVRHLDYIHFNPVKHGHAVRVQDCHIPRFAAGRASVSIRRMGPAIPAMVRRIPRSLDRAAEPAHSYRPLRLVRG
jgi:hypothetical protein